MLNAFLFAADGGKVSGLTQVGAGTVGALPKEGDYISLETAAIGPTFKVEAVAYILNEDAVRLIVSPISI